MNTRSIGYVVEACEGELLRGSPETLLQNACTDSRAVGKGDVFFALAGDKFDGHDFLSEVVQKGATCVVVQRDRVPAALEAGVIAVGNTRAAYGRLAARYRRDFSPFVVAVGGSNGKTTTKELAAAVLRQKYRTLWSEASFNNDVGVPSTLLRLEPEHQAAVLEVGTNHPGELAPLVRMLAPRYGILTGIGREHLEFFSDLAGVAREEGWLAELLPADGVLFTDGDSTWADGLKDRTKARTVRIGFGERNDWRIHKARVEQDGVSFTVTSPVPGFAGEYFVSLLGRHQAFNATLALAAGAELGVQPAEARQALQAVQAARMRLQSLDLHGVRFLNDAYNANADSMIAALRTLMELPCKGRRVAVLGEMAELGSHSKAAHEEVGRRVAEFGVGQLFAVGRMASVLARGARQAGLNRVLEFQDVASAAGAVKSFVRSGDLVLIKASRAARLEQLAEMLRTN